MKTRIFLTITLFAAAFAFYACNNTKNEKCKKDNCPMQSVGTCNKACKQHCADTCTMACCKATVEALDVANLLNKEYVVTAIEGTALTTSNEEQPTMTFNWEEQQVAGTTGCNNFFAKFTAKNCGIITFAEAGTTRMACPDMTTEDAFLAAWAKVTRVAKTAEGINLTDDNANALLTLQVK